MKQRFIFFAGASLLAFCSALWAKSASIADTFSLTVAMNEITVKDSPPMSAKPSKSATKPNILLIMADDLGHDDLSIHGHPNIRTPNLDKLATNSVKFTDFSVTPVCSTTRAALLTGRHPYKTGVSGVHGGRDFMHRSETLLAEHLQVAGYRTGIWGKWHIGKTRGYFPWDRGFDQGYYAELYQHNNSHGWLNGKAVQHEKWVSEVITDYAIDFIKHSKSDDPQQPFFAYVSYLAPHEPWLAPSKYVQPHIDAGLRPAIANLYGMVEEMDDQIGRLLATLQQQNVLDNTLVIFLSDNGPWWDSSNFGAMTQQEWQQRNPSKLKGNKGQTWQNGIKSPLFFHLPAKYSPQTVERYVDVKDLFPTVLDLINYELPAGHVSLDGISFLPFISPSSVANTAQKKHETVSENPRTTLIASHDLKSHKPGFNQWTPVDDAAREQIKYSNQIIGLRTEQYKLILNPSTDRPNYPVATNDYLLFDMQRDPLEQHNLFLEKPDVAAKMVKILKKQFIGIIDDPTSLAPPVYFVGNTAEPAVINGFGPASTSGNTHSKAHHLSHMRNLGDKAVYHLDIQTQGEHELVFTQDNTDSAGLFLKVELEQLSQKPKQVNENNFTELTSVSLMLNGSAQQSLGTFTLHPGSARLSIEVVENQSIKPWTSISGLRRLIFVKQGEINRLSDFTYPH